MNPFLQPVVWVAATLYCGAYGAHWAREIPVAPWLGFAASAAFGVAAWTLVESARRYWLCLLLSALALGFGLASVQWRALDHTLPVGSVEVWGRVASFPVPASSGFGKARVKFEMDCAAFRSMDGRWTPCRVRARASVPAGPVTPRYGDEILLRGSRNPVVSSGNPGAFDAEFYLESHGVSARLVARDPGDWVQTGEGRGNWAVAAAGRLRQTLKDRLNRAVPQPESGLLQALLLGDQQDIPVQTRDDFSKSGTAHLLAVSGGNVALVAFLILFLLRIVRIPRRMAYALSVPLLTGYAFLAGGGASVVRSTLMVSLAFLAVVFKREDDVGVSLAWAAILLLLASPLQAHDLGFQLSFLSVLALAVVSRREPDEAEDQSSRFKTIKNAACISLAAWLATAPITASAFYMFSPVTVIANLVVVPLAAAVTAAGAAFVTLGTFFSPLAEPLSAAAWALAKLMIAACRWFAHWPMAYVRTAPPPMWLCVAAYALMVSWSVRKIWPGRSVRASLWIVALSGLFVWAGAFSRRTPTLSIHVLNVGHGDALVVETPQGNLLVDAGPGGLWDQGRMTVAPFLWNRGITRLNGIVITHPHLDHYGGLRYLLEEFKVGAVFDNGDRSVPLYEETFRGLNVPRKTLLSGDRLEGWSGADLIVLNPPALWVGNKDIKTNDQSVVLSVRYGNVVALLTGDAEAMAQERLARLAVDLKCDFLKVPHHGSDEGAAMEAFLSRTRPQAAAISEAERNRYHLPSPVTVERLKRFKVRLLQTGLDGAVTFETDGSTWSVRNWR